MTFRFSVLAASLLIAACGRPGSAAASDAASTVDRAPAGSAASSGAGSPAPPPAVPSSPAATDVQATGRDESNAGVHEVLARVLVAVGRLDGEPITGVEQRTRCSTAFRTRNGGVSIDWTNLGEWQARMDGDLVLIPLVNQSGERVFSVPAGLAPEPVGDARARVEGGFGTLLDSCQDATP